MKNRRLYAVLMILLLVMNICNEVKADTLLLDNKTMIALSSLLVAMGLTFNSYQSMVNTVYLFYDFVRRNSIDLYNIIVSSIDSGRIYLTSEIQNIVEQFVNSYEVGIQDISSDVYIEGSEGQFAIRSLTVYNSQSVYYSTNYYRCIDIGNMSFTDYVKTLPDGFYNIYKKVTIVPTSFGSTDLYVNLQYSSYTIPKTSVYQEFIYTELVLLKIFSDSLGNRYYKVIRSNGTMTDIGSYTASVGVSGSYRVDYNIGVEGYMERVADASITISSSDVLVDLDTPKNNRDKEILIIPPVSLGDLVGKKWDEMTYIDSGTAEYTSGIATGIQALVNLFTEGLIGDINTLTYPKLNVSLSEKFPFSLPWDIYNLISLFNEPALPLSLSFKLGSVYGNSDINIKISDYFDDDFMEKVRFLEKVGFLLTLIFITPKVLGGAK
ncbi:MAG: hypothetical protein ACPLKS_07435 [Caldisericum exile]|uniref:hypothetical protein n=1 Tax=Caldisericum exile TaxID=693075 RepID=UPI003C761462